MRMYKYKINYLFIAEEVVLGMIKIGGEETINGREDHLP
jgi:hypothetical protein